MKRINVLLAIILVVHVAGAGAFAAPLYRVNYLGFNFVNGVRGSINNHRQIVGVHHGLRGFIYEAGHFTYLDSFKPQGLNVAVSINEAGQVVGSATTPDNVGHPYLYDNGLLTDLGTLPGYPSGAALDVNELSEVVGRLGSPDGTITRAFAYRSGVLTDLGPGEASAINASGVIVGNFDGDPKGFRYENGNYVDLGYFSTDSRAVHVIDINDSGQVAGYYGVTEGDGNSRAHPFIYESGTWRDLGLPPALPFGHPRAVNNKGQIVGNSALSLGSNNRPPFLYTDGAIYNLQTLLGASGAGLTLQLVYDINDHGEILAQGKLGRDFQAVLLTPVPEPMTYILVICAFLSRWLLNRQRGAE